MSQSTQAEEVLAKLVIVSRHGVRTPIVPASQLAHWAAAPWPDWKQPAGSLTPRGAELARIMGTYYRRYASEGQATAAAGCPPVYVYADLTERTQASAKALHRRLRAQLRVQLSIAPRCEDRPAVPSACRPARARSIR